MLGREWKQLLLLLNVIQMHFDQKGLPSPRLWMGTQRTVRKEKQVEMDVIAKDPFVSRNTVNVFKMHRIVRNRVPVSIVKILWGMKSEKNKLPLLKERKKKTMLPWLQIPILPSLI